MNASMFKIKNTTMLMLSIYTKLKAVSWFYQSGP